MTPAGLRPIYFFLAARYFAQRARAAAAILRRAAALILRRFRGGRPTEADEPPNKDCSLAWSFSIFCFNEIIRFSLAVDRLSNSVIESQATRNYSRSLVCSCRIY